MRLSDDLIESLLWSLGAEQRGDDLRRSPRVGARGIAMLVPIVEGARQEGREVLVRDISADGASLVLASALKCDQFILQIRGQQRPEPLSILCAARYCEKSDEGGWAVGAEFLRFLPARGEKSNRAG